MADFGEFTYWYRATVISNHDGDTLTLNIDLGRRCYSVDAIRLLGINAPELSEVGGKESRDYLSRLCPEGTEIRVQTFKNKNDKYGRWLGVVYLPGSENLICVNDRMVESGHAKKAEY